MADAPASVTVVSAEEIARSGYRTLAEVLYGVRSFYTTYDRNRHHAGVRGFARPGDHNSRVLLLVNGHRINDNVYDSASIGTEFPLDIDLVDRVEIVRGPSSSLYGTSAFLAVVNVITRARGPSSMALLPAFARPPAAAATLPPVARSAHLARPSHRWSLREAGNA